MTSCPEVLGILGIWKKAGSWDSDLGEASRLCALQAPHVGWVSWSWDSTLEEGRRFSELAEARQVVYDGGVACGGVRWKSQDRKKVCLSLLMSKNLKLKKVIKSFVPEPKESRQVLWVFSDSDTRKEITNFLYIRILCMWISWSYVFGRGSDYVTGKL